MPHVEIGFSAVISDVHFTMLKGVHGPGVDINIGVELLKGYRQATAFQKSANGCGC